MNDFLDTLDFNIERDRKFKFNTIKSDRFFQNHKNIKNGINKRYDLYAFKT